jgi:hypothetical protein
MKTNFRFRALRNKIQNGLKNKGGSNKQMPTNPGSRYIIQIQILKIDPQGRYTFLAHAGDQYSFSRFCEDDRSSVS